MKSLRVTKSGNKFKIEGYPGAVSVGSIAHDKDAIDLMHLSLHFSDIEFCSTAIERLLNDEVVKGDRFLTESMWIACVSRFYKCFQFSKSRVSLSIEELLENEPPEAREVYDYFKALRDKHLIHDENAYLQANVGVVVNDETTAWKIADVVTSVVTLRTDDDSHLKSFKKLILHTHEWLEKRRESLHELLAKRYEQQDYANLLSLPTMTYRSPNRSAVAKRR